jgi:hypothetical protein
MLLTVRSWAPSSISALAAILTFALTLTLTLALTLTLN